MKRATLASLFLAMACSSIGCVTRDASNTTPAESPKPVVIQKRSVVPSPFRDAPLPPTIQVPRDIALLRQVIRPRAEVREGPGTEYPLVDKLLAEGTEVLAFARYGIWQKIYDPATKTSGWVHHQTLGEPEKNDKLLEIEPSQLPRVFTTRAVTRGFEVDSFKRLGVEIPKGTVLTALRESKRLVLVVIGSTQSVIWLTKKDAQ